MQLVAMLAVLPIVRLGVTPDDKGLELETSDADIPNGPVEPVVNGLPKAGISRHLHQPQAPHKIRNKSKLWRAIIPSWLPQSMAQSGVGTGDNFILSPASPPVIIL
ncbi:hypothetical protein VN97_g515 [Penicillium thymicola]|uniref:Secreted protein n=1 Tax=Penicillium thymicola TaxID=293382 RepID=A0AAI9XEC0_PENTH|nr:hypothetical protein VN97_g515 [Penicillium thymicola]